MVKISKNIKFSTLLQDFMQGFECLAPLVSLRLAPKMEHCLSRHEPQRKSIQIRAQTHHMHKITLTHSEHLQLINQTNH